MKVNNIYYPVDFVVLDTEPMAESTHQVPIILGRPFLATANVVINCRNGVMQLTFGNMTLELNIFHLSNRDKPVEDKELKSKELSNKDNPSLCLTLETLYCSSFATLVVGILGYKFC